MARKPIVSEHSGPKRPKLQLPRTEAAHILQSQIKKGKSLLELLESGISSQNDFEVVEAEEKKWSDYNADLLKGIVDTDDLYTEYCPNVGVGLYSFGRESLSYWIGHLRSEIKDKITCLESISERLSLIQEVHSVSAPASPPQAHVRTDTSQVFVVHGHDEEAKESVARLIEKLGFKAIIFHEQPNQGRTIIEKFENNAHVGFAVVLLTPDDVGASKTDTGNLQPRARQNVILELGFFVGRLGRQRVCALRRGEVEIPSDYLGVVWTSMDEGGAWRLALAQELKAAGLDVDLNRLV